METRYVEDGVAREEAYARELYDMQAADAENYQKLKVKLETDVAILEQQLEHMKVRLQCPNDPMHL
jgi:dynein regulatry complex protein 1